MVSPLTRHRIRICSLLAVLVLLFGGIALVPVSPEAFKTNTRFSRQQPTASREQRVFEFSKNSKKKTRAQDGFPEPTYADTAIETSLRPLPSRSESLFSTGVHDSDTRRSDSDAQLRNRNDDPSFGDRFDDPMRRAELYRLKRVPVGANEIPMERYQDALDHVATMRRYSTESNQFSPSKDGSAAVTPESLATWTNLGPGNIGGRTRAIVIDPTSPNTMYAAAVTGGVWKSINGGASWFPTSDLMANLNICALAMDRANSNVLYAGTGELYTRWRGNGVFKTSDGGVNWTQLAATANDPNFYSVTDIVISPSNSQRLYATTGTGVWRSVNAGTNWTRVLNPNTSDGCTDLAIRTDATGQAADWVFAACGVSNQATVYRNTNAGGAGTWDSVLTETNMSRTSLALAPSNQSTVYALSSDSTNLYGRSALHAVFRSTSGGSSGSWTARVRNTDPVVLNTYLLSSLDGGYSQGWYDNVIAVDPINENRVWAGGIMIFRSDDGGANWGWAFGIHADHHAITFHPQYDGVNNKTLLVGNDGGIYRTIDATAPICTSLSGCSNSVSFNSLNSSYAATQFYYGLPYPDGLTYFGGTQDNGGDRGSDEDGINGWRQICCGDASYVAIDPNNTNILYVNGNQGEFGIHKSTDGGVTFGPAMTGINDNPGPLIMDPANSQRLWTGDSVLWRTDNAANNWSQASTSLRTEGFVTAIGISPLNSDNVLAGSVSGFIHRTNAGRTANASTNWPSALPRMGYVSWLTYDPTNGNIAYATYSSFNSSSSDRHVYKSTDGGASWTGIDGIAPNNLPDVPTHTIVVDPTNTQRLYVGTDVGVFSSLDGGIHWAVENSGFAYVITESLAINTSTVSSKYLFAFTHGRGAWRVLLSSGCPSITSLSNQIAAVGSTITINGSGFLNATGVKFSNNVSAMFNVVGDSQITTAVPTGAITGPITVSKANCADSQSTSITISGCPTVNGLSTLIVGVGDTVTINGDGLSNINTIKFSNNVSASFNIISDTQVNAVVPAGAVGGPIIISKAGCPNVQTTNLTICPSPLSTLSIDNGSSVSAASYGNNAYYVNRLTPTSYPSSLYQVSIYFGSLQNLPPGTPMTVLIGTNPSGTVNIDNINFQTFSASVGTLGQFNTYSLPNSPQINSGDFVVGFTTAGGNNMFPVANSTNPFINRSYYSLNGKNFSPGVQNFMIRATVFPGTCSSSLQLLLDESGPSSNQAAALDSLLFTRDPFPVVNSANSLNLGVDRNTRVVLFVANLQLAQGEPSSSVVVNVVDANNQSFDLAAEDVRLVPRFTFTQVIFRLPDNLAVGTCVVRVKAHGQISNSGTVRIRI